MSWLCLQPNHITVHQHLSMTLIYAINQVLGAYTGEQIALPTLCHTLRKSLKGLFPTPTTSQRIHLLASATSSVSTPLAALRVCHVHYTLLIVLSPKSSAHPYTMTQGCLDIIHLKGSTSRSELICIEMTIYILSETPDMYLSLSLLRRALVLRDMPCIGPDS